MPRSLDCYREYLKLEARLLMRQQPRSSLKVAIKAVADFADWQEV